MCLLSEAELNCVSTNMRITSELMQFEMGTSTRRYLPPSGTAGFERNWVRGNRRLPAPPPRMTARRFDLAGIIGPEDIGKGARIQGLGHLRGRMRDSTDPSVPRECRTWINHDQQSHGSFQ